MEFLEIITHLLSAVFGAAIGSLFTLKINKNTNSQNGNTVHNGNIANGSINNGNSNTNTTE